MSARFHFAWCKCETHVRADCDETRTANHHINDHWSLNVLSRIENVHLFNILQHCRNSSHGRHRKHVEVYRRGGRPFTWLNLRTMPFQCSHSPIHHFRYVLCTNFRRTQINALIIKRKLSRILFSIFLSFSSSSHFPRGWSRVCVCVCVQLEKAPAASLHFRLSAENVGVRASHVSLRK